MATSKILPTIFSLLILTISAHNITEILDSDPNLSEFNSYLTRTKLADDINSLNAHPTLTVLAIPNSEISTFTSNTSISAIKSILSLHILLDYYDSAKLHNINGQATSTNLYQTTGMAEDQIGQVNITVQKGGVVVFGSCQPGSKPVSKFVKEIRTIPFTLSVLEISTPIIVPTLLTSGDIDLNITKVLENAGCRTFAALLLNSGVGKSYQKQIDSGDGITIFAPRDDGFRAKGLPDLSKLSNAELVALLQFHALGSYAPTGTLKSTKGNLKTLAPAGKYGLTATSAGDTITLHTGIVNSRVALTLRDSSPVVIFSVDSVLLPEALFGKNSSAPTPAPTPANYPTVAPANSPVDASPPAPPMVTPVSSPASDGGNDGSSEDSGAPEKSDDSDSKKSAAARGNVSLLRVVVVAVVSGVSLFLF